MKKQMFGAILLSAALAMGTAVPAFAEGEEEAVGFEDQTIESTSGDLTDTEVFVQTKISQINVTVPVRLVLAADADGGDLTTPTNYAISNKSACDIYIINVKANNEDEEAWKLTDKADEVGAGVVPGQVTYGNIKINLNDIIKDPITLLHELNMPITNKINNGTSSKPKWEYIGVINKAENAETPSTLTIGVDGASSALNNLVEEDAALAAACTVTYTISITPNE